MDWVFFCSDDTASHIFTPEDVATRGVGGAELALIDLTTELARLGEEVRIYNICDEPRIYNGVQYIPVYDFDPFTKVENFVLYRNPANYVLPIVNAKHKAFFSLDQQTSGNYGTDIFPFVQTTVTISPYHRQYHIDRYHVDPKRIVSFDLGVRLNEYRKPVEKVPSRLIYTSTPSRGLHNLAKIFPLIKYLVSDAELYITSPSWGFGLETQNHPSRALFEGLDGVHFLGRVPRDKLVELQLSADILAYPNESDGPFYELFCIAAAEAQVAGAIPVTSKFGGLATTVIQPEGILIDDYNDNPLHPSDPEYVNQFVERIVGLLSNRKELVKRQHSLQAKAIRRFSWERIAKEWIQLIESLP